MSNTPSFGLQGPLTHAVLHDTALRVKRPCLTVTIKDGCVQIKDDAAEMSRAFVVGAGADDVALAQLFCAAPDLLQMLRDVDAHFAAHFGEQAWATSEIGGMTRVAIAKVEGGAA